MQRGGSRIPLRFRGTGITVALNAAWSNGLATMPSPAPRQVSLALAGGNALGAYAAGAYEALHEAGYRPDIVAGCSIGAVNGTLIAGNPPEQRVQRLREFWRQASLGSAFGIAPSGGKPRDVYNRVHVMQTVLMGRPGLFSPRPEGFMSMMPGMPPASSLFDPRPLVATLERLVDFDLLNSAAVPLVISAVDVLSGEPVYFDSRKQRIEPLHLLASTAFIPGFPPVEIDGRMLADPGLYCNVPLDPVLSPAPACDHLCFAVDLFDSRGELPRSLDTSLERAQDLVFASQTVRTLEAHRREQRLRHMIHRLTALSGRSADAAWARAELASEGRSHEQAVALIAYHPPAHELGAKMVEFSRASIEERWNTGMHDMRAAVTAVESARPTEQDHGFTFYDARQAR